MVAGGSVSDRFVGTTLAGEHRVLGLDPLVRANRRGDLDELAEKLAAEHPVVFEPLIAALELGDAVLSGALRRRRARIKAYE